jgi:phage host-nuclease inhibitor protein Gam
MVDDDKALVKRLGAQKNNQLNAIEAAARIEAQAAEIERLREALKAYTEYCNICHGRGCIIEEDSVTGADLWRDCPGCKPARAALGETE